MVRNVLSVMLVLGAVVEESHVMTISGFSFLCGSNRIQ